MFFRCRAFRGVTTAILMACLWAAGFGGNAAAADLQVSPISLEFSPREQARGIWLSNTGAKPLRAQVRVQQWTQTDNQDQLGPTRELSASPPAVDIPPGGKQLVRIIRQQPAAPAIEQSYRLIVDELRADTVDGSPPPGLQFLMRYLVPVFVAVEAPPPADGRQTDISVLSASLQTASKPPQLVVKNTGRTRFKLAQLAYVDADGRRTVLAPGLMGYVLAGQQMQWPLKVAPPPGAFGAGAFKAKFNADLEEQTLPLVNTRP
jgi:fimbrial chaperone protein